MASIENRTLRKRVKDSAHDFAAVHGWSLDAAEFEKKRGLFDFIEVTVEHTGLVYAISTFDFIRYVREMNEPNQGRQYVVLLRFWTVRREDYQPELEMPVKG